MKKSHYYEIIPSSWEDAKSIGKKLSPPNYNFIFRGQANKDWGLKTSLERITEKYLDDLSWVWYFEKQIIEKFKTRAHHYIQSPPQDTDYVEWLSVIQHYGGPTRLLDFSESFYVSAFFSIDLATEDACVWAINETSLLNHFNEKTNFKFQLNPLGVLKFAESQMFDSTNNYDLVLPISPSRLNERLSVQKGKFLFPCNTLKGFEANLCSTFDLPFQILDSTHATIINFEDFETILNDMSTWPSILKITFSKSWFREAVRDLYLMNIDAASLFPGLEGFARSLSYILLKQNYEDII